MWHVCLYVLFGLSLSIYQDDTELNDYPVSLIINSWFIKLKLSTPIKFISV